jgi:aminoglycoside 3-N-acetyltransferase
MDCLADALDRGGVPADGTVIVHSAFRELGRQGWQAEAVIEALKHRLAEGTLLMPTMTWRTVTPAANVFDELATPSHTGILTELFRRGHAQARSLHPTHSVAGWGRNLDHLLGGHHLGCTPCPPDSPYGRMRSLNAFVLLLGVGMESCTAVHFIEERITPDLTLCPIERMESYLLRDRHGVTRPMKLRRHQRLDRDFHQFGREMLVRGEMVQGDFGGVPWRLFPIAALYPIVEAALTANPHAIIQTGRVT